MKHVRAICFALTLAAPMAALLGAQTASTRAQKGATPQGHAPAERTQPLVLTETIPLEGIKGRFDHFGYGPGHVFVSELGNNSVGVIEVGGRTVEKTIAGVPDPQGVAHSPEAKKLFVGSGRGKLYIFGADSWDQVATVDFQGGADNVRYDAATRRIYVGCGNDEKTGAIGVVDAMTNQRIDEYKLGGEPESFQLEKSGPNFYVNVPDLKQVVVINRQTKATTRWRLAGISSNFPMALDEADHRLFIGTHDPARLVVLDTTNGNLIASLPSVQDTDDLYWDGEYKRVYMPGGEGFIYVFQMKAPEHYERLAKIPTAIGARTAGYFGRQGKGFNRFFLAVPARGVEPAEIRIYTVQQ
jgi:DNA-binding beta-propeller fold protein YncE